MLTHRSDSRGDPMPGPQRPQARGVVGSLAAFRGIAAFPAPFLGGLMYDHLGYSVPIVANLVGAAAVTATIYFVLRDPPAGGIEATRSS